MRRSTKTALVCAGMLTASLVLWPVVLLRARRPKPRSYTEEQRERRRLSAQLDAEARVLTLPEVPLYPDAETEYQAYWSREEKDAA